MNAISREDRSANTGLVPAMKAEAIACNTTLQPMKLPENEAAACQATEATTQEHASPQQIAGIHAYTDGGLKVPADSPELKP